MHQLLKSRETFPLNKSKIKSFIGFFLSLTLKVAEVQGGDGKVVTLTLLPSPGFESGIFY